MQKSNVRPLNLLVFIALFWSVVIQFRAHPIAELGARYGLVAKGYLGTDLYLVAAGFIACGLLLNAGPGWRAWEAVAWRRIAPRYSLHLATIGTMGALYLAASASGAAFDPAAFEVTALPANLLLVHAWGALPTVYWNFPSWLLSAELFGCVALPVFAVAARGGLARAAFFAGVALVTFELGFVLAQHRGILFTDMTAQIGAARVIPDFLAGAVVWRFAQSIRPRAWESIALALLSVAWIVAGTSARISDALVWPAFGPLIFAVATFTGRARTIVEAPGARYLGRIAWAVYLVHLPVEIAWFHMLDRVFRPGVVPAPIALIGVFPVIVAAGAAAHHLIERPAWRLLHRLLTISDRRLARREEVPAT